MPMGAFSGRHPAPFRADAGAWKPGRQRAPFPAIVAPD